MTEEDRLEAKATRSSRFSVLGTTVAALRALRHYRYWRVNAPHRSAETYRFSRIIAKGAIIVMVLIIGALALLALFANSERFRRDDLEKVEVRLALPPKEHAR